MRKYVDSSIGQRTPFGTYTNEPSENTAEFRAAKKLSPAGTTLPRYCSMSCRMIAHGIGEGAEDDARLAELVLEGGRHRHAVEYRIHRDAREAGALVQRNAELLVGREQLRVHLIDALRAFFGARGAE